MRKEEGCLFLPAGRVSKLYNYMVLRKYLNQNLVILECFGNHKFIFMQEAVE
jgi:hypothetical protein